MNHPPTAQEARLSEIFSSLQGEGTHMGERHLFIRFEECHIHCEYCDELGKPARSFTLDEVMETVAELEHEEGPHACVSLTGGEPLLYLPFLKQLLPSLKMVPFRAYLETAGILWQALAQVIGWCDVIAMDLKPASVTKERSFLKEHRRFLELARAKEVFIKIILSEEIDIQEFHSLIRLVKDVSPETPVLLQPVSTPELPDGLENPKLMELLPELRRSASRMLPDVRIAPRLHKILKIR